MDGNIWSVHRIIEVNAGHLILSKITAVVYPPKPSPYKLTTRTSDLRVKIMKTVAPFNYQPLTYLCTTLKLAHGSINKKGPERNQSDYQSPAK